MVIIEGRLVDPRHIELTEPVPPGEQSVQVQLSAPVAENDLGIALLVNNAAFDFLRDEPDLYE
jgi:hypothetical protein